MSPEVSEQDNITKLAVKINEGQTVSISTSKDVTVVGSDEEIWLRQNEAYLEYRVRLTLGETVEEPKMWVWDVSSLTSEHIAALMTCLASEINFNGHRPEYIAQAFENVLQLEVSPN